MKKKSIQGLLKLKDVPILDLVGKTDLVEIFLIMKKSKYLLGMIQDLCTFLHWQTFLRLVYLDLVIQKDIIPGVKKL